jgi:hypothetical protein
MNLKRALKLSRKFAGIFLNGCRPTSIKGRFTGPRVIINSVPKSGTNLVQEILHQFPLLRGRVTKTLTSEMNEEELLRKVASIRRGEVMPAHIFYDEKIASLMCKEDIKMIFVVRDFRDAMLSHINYIDQIDITHPHHQVFAGLKGLDEKIDACLLGVRDKFQSWPNLVRGFRGWVNAENVMLVRFEDLIGEVGGGNGETQRAVVIEMANFLGIELPDVQKVIRNMYNENGLTFNAPEIGKWKKKFSQEQVERINAFLLEDIRYFSHK